MKTEQVQDKRRHERSIKVFIEDPYMNLIFLKQQTPDAAHEMLIWTLDRAIRSTLFNNVKLKLNEMVILDAKAGSRIIKNIWSAREREKKVLHTISNLQKSNFPPCLSLHIAFVYRSWFSCNLAV